MSRSERTIPALTVETSAIADPGLLTPLLDRDDPLLFMRAGDGIAGIGTALRLEFSGPGRMTDAASAWRQVTALATVLDPLAKPGTGLVALGSFAFSDHSAETSVLIVPSLVIGRRDGLNWITRISLDHGATAGTRPAELLSPQPLGIRPAIPLRSGAMSVDDYRAAVDSAMSRIRADRLSKVVLARDLVGTLPDPFDLRSVIDALALGYPDCWTFAIDGLVGSSPEMLVRVDHGSVGARVLAGSAARGSDPQSDLTTALALATSVKDLDEHEYAVQSVLSALGRHSDDVMASDQPFTMKLPNVWHLASDIDGTLRDRSSSLDLIAALHPTAAVAGTPTGAALATIDELEPFDRGRYAGPVGWVGADGDGEWAIALRCAQVSATTVTAYAGAGIVDGSVAARELAETTMKFRPVVEAFGRSD